MSTTTIRLPQELKARVAEAAKAAGTTSHSFILDAIAEKTRLAEQNAEYHAIAEQRCAGFLETGESIPWEEAREWLKQRLAGKAAKRPVAKPRGG